MKLILLPVFICLLNGYCKAQLSIAPFAGYQTDLNNKSHFNQVNTGVQLSLKIKRTNRYELLLELQKNWAVPYHSTDSSFSANPSMPVYANAKKTIRPSAYSLAVGHRFSIFGAHTNNIFSILIYGGLSYQKLEVTYDYNKASYIILNPDQTIERIGLFLSAGLEYMRVLKHARIFIRATAASPPVAKKINYPLSFNLMAPLSFNAGYAIPLKSK